MNITILYFLLLVQDIFHNIIHNINNVLVEFDNLKYIVVDNSFDISHIEYIDY